MNFIKSFLKKRLRQELSSTKFKQVVLIPDASLATVQSKQPLENKRQCQPKTYTPEEIETIRQKIAKVSWYHAYELIPGVTTPGYSPFNAADTLDFHQVPRNLTGKKVLDIGTWDGPLAFEFERRGAIVTALDIQNPDCTGFNTAKEILQSNITYIQASVYDLSQIFQEKFDIISFFGVYYHLKYPLLAFEEIAKVLKPESFLLFEGECLRNYAETLDNSKIRGTHGWQLVQRLKSRKVREISTIANSDFPLTLCYPSRYRDASNWFIPNLSCIFSWLEGTGLEMISYLLIEDLDSQPFSVQRIRGVARKSQNAPPEEHPVFPKNWRNL